ncbi:hypothetical protein [Archangium lansingense]|uniref:Phage protein n=1 Tax=Archangium lansingense TaxID=2995310 RepID=A0ABT4A0D0_9BACT|nr:hypothetical protein [Archangium lansinium]MCY1074439.1 hypothetical protein [Archangium lansinium]
MKQEDKPSSGETLGPYHITRRYRGIGGGVGRLYETRNNETGNAALVLSPGPKGELRPENVWQVRAISSVTPPYLALEVEHAPEGGQVTQLAWMLDRWTTALLRLDERPEAQAHLTGGPKEPRSRPGGWLRSPRIGLAMAALLALPVVLWPRSTVHHQTVNAMVERPVFTRPSDESATGIQGFPMPSKPFEGQKKPPCDAKRAEVEIHGGCWMEIARRPPCSEGAADYQGKCYVAVGTAPRVPTSIGP